MKDTFCVSCQQKHNLYYLIKTNNTRAMFYLCPKLKGQEKVFVVFTPLIDGLDIPSYLSGSGAYEELKGSVRTDGEFTDSDRKVISLWRTAKLLPQQMTEQQIDLVRRYVRGNPRW